MRAGTFITRIANLAQQQKRCSLLCFRLQHPEQRREGGRVAASGGRHTAISASSSGFNCAELRRRGTPGESRRNLIDRISGLAACRNSLIGLPCSFVRIVARQIADDRLAPLWLHQDGIDTPAAILTTASDGIISNVVSAKLRQGVKPRPFTASGALINLFHDDAADSTTDSATAIAVRHFAENAASCLALALVRFPSLETLAPDDPRYRTCAIRTDDRSFYLASRRT